MKHRWARMVAERGPALEALIGYSLIIAGVAQLSTAAAFIVAGGILFLLALWRR